MPNGRGALECCYCVHWQAADGKSGYGPGCLGAGRCSHWKVEIPAAEPPGSHRICADFSPNEDYERHNRPRMEYRGQTTTESVRQRISWFGIDLKPGVLYVFSYNNPPGLRAMMQLTRDETEAAGDE
jgi:hypothetical protein